MPTLGHLGIYLFQYCNFYTIMDRRVCRKKISMTDVYKG